MSHFIFLVLGLLVGFFILFWFLFRMEAKNTLLNIDETSLCWKDIRCVSCNEFMQHGYAFAGRGIIWSPEQAKKPGTFVTVDKVLENTCSFRVPPPLNKAWYCADCHMLLLDNSKLLKINRLRNT